MSVGAAYPKDDGQNNDYSGNGNDSPWNFNIRIARKIFSWRANVFGPWKLQARKFLDLQRRMRFRARLAGLEKTLFRCDGAALRRPRQRRTFRFPDLVGVDLRLAEAGKIIGDGFFSIHSEMLGIGANESLVEDTAGQLIEVLFFDGLEHARTDLGDIGNGIERDVFFLARLAEFVSEFAHSVLPGKASFARMMTGTS